MRVLSIISIVLTTVFAVSGYSQSGLCDPTTPFYMVDMTGNPGGTWISPADKRIDYCCGASGNDNCIEFELTLDPGAAAINFGIASGAVPPGALYYQINCGPIVQVGQPICIDGVGPHTLTFCKPGNNTNEYSIESIPAPAVSPDDTIGNGCSKTLGTIGIELVGITWTTVGPGAVGQYDSFFSCTSDCDSTVFTPVAPYPPYIDVQICGTPVAIDCYPDPNYCDTIRITLLDPVDIILGPDPAIFCTSDPGITLTSMVSGGVPPYNYIWYDPGGGVIGTNTTAFASSGGAYTLEVQDANYPGCPSFAETMVVSTQPLPVVEAGPPFSICPTNPTVDFSGTVTGASGLQWSAGGTTFAPSSTSLSGSYSATSAEAGSSSFYVYATSTGNGLCPAVTDSMIVNVLDTVKAIISGDAVVCYGETTTLFGSGTGGTGPYIYSWSTGSTASSITVGAGTYSLTVTDATTHACSGTISFTVTENPPLDITVPSAPIITCDSTAQISIGATGGNGSNYTFVWSNGLSGNTVTVNTGTYFVTATDGMGCTVTEQVAVTASNSALTASIAQPATVCFGASANFSVTASGGFPPYSYDWTTGDITQGSSGPAGQYCVTVEDTLGCIYTACVIVNEAPPLTLYIPPSNPICYGATTDVVAQAGGGTPPYTYQWSTGSFNDTITVGGGSYDVTVVDANANQCTITGSTTVSEGDPVQIAFTTTPVSCFGGSNGTAAATVTGGFPNYQYSWSNGAVTPTATGLTANTTYTLNINDANGCTGTNTISVTEPTVVIPSIVDSTAVSCKGGSDGTATAFATGGTPPYSYNWFTSAGVAISQTSITATGLTAGLYYVAVTDANGCTVNSPTTTIIQPTILTATTTPTATSCFGSCDGYIEANGAGGNGGYSYSWSDSLVQTNVIAQNLCAGTYTVTVTDSKGCQTTASGTISQPTQVSLSTTVVNANCFQANGEGCVSATGGTGPYQYFWPNGFQGECQLGLLANSYVVSASDANGCQAQIAVNVQNLPGPVAGILNSQDVSCNSGCNGAATVGITSGTGGAFTVQWDAAAANQITPTASNLCAGIYGVQITDTNGCSSSTSVTILEPPVLAISVPYSDPLCNGDCNGQANVNVAGGTPAYGYQWVNSVGTVIGNNDSISGLCSGTYSMLVTDQNGCQISETIILTDPPLITGSVAAIDVSCNSSCDGVLTATALSGTAPYSMTWDANAGNQTTMTATDLCAGSYTGVLTDSKGCQTTLNGTVTEPTVLTISILNSQDALCHGQCNGFAEVVAAGGTPPYNITWSNGMNGSLAQNLCIGNYCATVTDDNGCTAVVCVDIDEPDPLQLNLSKVNVNCFGACNGEAIVLPSGGTGPYSYVWSNGSTSSYINSLCKGIYEIDITDANGCAEDGVVSITQPNEIQITLISSTDANCNQANGEICVNVTGGSGSIQLQWLDPDLQVTNCASNLEAGCYALQVSDGNGCVKDTTFCIDNIAGPTITLSQLDDANCTGASDGTIVTSVSGSTNPLTINWYDGSFTQLTAFTNQQIITGLAADCYTIEVTDGAGCTASQVHCVSEPQTVTTIFNQVTHNSCYNSCDGEAGAYVSGGTAPYSYSWSQGNNVTSDYNTGLCAGQVDLIVTDSHGCTATNSVTINEPTELMLSSITVTDNLCAGQCTGAIQATIIGGTQPYSYTWSSGFNNGSQATNLCAGSYTLDILDYKGCDTTFTWLITEPSPLDLATSSTNSTCGLCNASASVTPSGGTTPYSFQWTTGDITPTVSGSLCEGIHYITVTDGNNCSETEQITVIDEPSPIIDSLIFNEPACFGAASGSGTVYASGGATFGAYNYSWSPSTGNQSSQTAIAISAGYHCVTVSDVNNCPASICGPMLQPNQVVSVPDGDTTICYGQEAVIWGSASGGTQPYTINWNSIPPLTGVGPHYVDPTLTQQYCFSVTDDNGCNSSNACVLVQVKPPLDIHTSQGVNICEGEEANLWVAVSGGDSDNYVITWYEDMLYGPLVTDVTFSNDTSYADFIPQDSSWYFIQLEDGCSNTIYDSIFVGVVIPGDVLVVIPETFGCAPLSVDVEVVSDDAAIYNFDFDCDGQIDLNTTSNIGTYVYEEEGVYDVCVTTINPFGCIAYAEQLNAITVWPTPSAYFVSSDAAVSIYEPSVTFDDQSSGGTINQWHFGEGDSISGPTTGPIDNQQNAYTYGTYDYVTHEYTEVGTYPVTLIVSNIYGCKDTMIREIIVSEEFSIYVPNTITPDGDILNETFNIYATGIVDDGYELMIFDRWGLLLFQTTNKNEGWDATFKGQPVQQDAYIWKLHAKNENGEEFNLIGHVNVLR